MIGCAHHQAQCWDVFGSQGCNGAVHQRFGDASPAIARIDGNGIEFAATPGDPCDAVAGDAVSIKGNQEQVPRYVPILEESFRRPGIGSKGRLLDFGDAF